MSTPSVQPIVSLLSEDRPGPHDVLVADEALLPMLLFPDVAVVLRDVRDPISILQRFLLQAAVDGRTLNLHEAQQATSIPIFALRRLSREFAQSGVFVSQETPDQFTPNDELCRRALATDRVELEKSGRMHFLFLPESNDLIALSNDEAIRRFVAALQTCVPDAGYPTTGVEGRGLGEFLQSRQDCSTITGLPSDFLRIEHAGTVLNSSEGGTRQPMPASAPAFRVAFTVTTEKGHARCRLKLLSPRRPAPIELSNAKGMIAMMTERGIVSRLPIGSVPMLVEIGVPQAARTELVFGSPVGATVSLDAWSAREVSAHGWLTHQYVVRVQQAALALTTRAQMCFVAADEDAHRLFAIDEAAQSLLRLKTPPSTQSLRDAAKHAGRGVCDADVTERLWLRREFASVHSIRAQEDLFHV